jgi:hypothetical protein
MSVALPFSMSSELDQPTPHPAANFAANNRYSSSQLQSFNNQINAMTASSLAMCRVSV